jgi:putative heme-binding domain-containing protein
VSFLEIAIGLMLAAQTSGDGAAGALEARLRTEDPTALACDARRLGDVRRGAAVFYQPSLTCTKCHTSATGAPSLGPDLTALGKDVADAYLVEAILEPSKAIKKGYETITINTEDGRTVTGLLGADRADAVAIRDPGQDGKAVTVRRDQIEERKDGGASIMPAGLVNNLRTRQQFLDLVRYLMEIAEQGPGRARELKPGSGQLYTCGLFGWAGDQTEPGGFYRVRATGKPMFLPIALSARKDGMLLRFTAALDPRATIDVSRYGARIWSIKRTANYGSDHHDERSLEITAASLSADGHTVFLKIPAIRPTRCMEITYRIRGKGGETVDGVIYNTIHQLGDAEARRHAEPGQGKR